MIDSQQPPAEILEANIQSLLLRHLRFWVTDEDLLHHHQNKPVKHGKLVLYTLKDFYVQFLLDVDGKQKVYEVPYPYRSWADEARRCVVFDYSFDTLANNSVDLFFKLKMMNRKKKSKLYDRYLKICVE